MNKDEILLMENHGGSSVISWPCRPLVNKANVSSSNGNQPRYIQLSVKFNF